MSTSTLSQVLENVVLGRGDYPSFDGDVGAYLEHHGFGDLDTSDMAEALHAMRAHLPVEDALHIPQGDPAPGTEASLVGPLLSSFSPPSGVDAGDGPAWLLQQASLGGLVAADAVTDGDDDSAATDGESADDADNDLDLDDVLMGGPDRGGALEFAFGAGAPGRSLVDLDGDGDVDQLDLALSTVDDQPDPSDGRSVAVFDPNALDAFDPLDPLSVPEPLTVPDDDPSGFDDFGPTTADLFNEDIETPE